MTNSRQAVNNLEVLRGLGLEPACKLTLSSTQVQQPTELGMITVNSEMIPIQVGILKALTNSRKQLPSDAIIPF